MRRHLLILASPGAVEPYMVDLHQQYYTFQAQTHQILRTVPGPSDVELRALPR